MQTVGRSTTLLLVVISQAFFLFLTALPLFAGNNETKLYSGTPWSEQQMLASILKSAPTGIGVVENRVFREVNDYILNLTGYTRAELIAHNTRILYQTQEEYDKAGQEVYAYLRAEHMSVPVEARWMRKDGTIRHVSLTLAPLDPHDTVGRYTMTVLDVTERKHSEDRFAKAFHASPAPLVVSEMDTGRFIDVNARWMEMLGYSREELIGRTSKEVGIWADPADRDRIIGVLREHGSFKDEPVQFITKSGGIISALWSAEIISQDGRVLLLSLIHDETARKQAEEALALRTHAFLAVLAGGIVVLLAMVVWLIAILRQRDKTMTALVESKENYATTLQSIGDGVIATDNLGLIANMNPVAENLCEWTLAQAKGRPLTEVFDIVHAHTRQPTTDPVRTVLDSGKVVGLASHTVLLSKNGQEYQIADSAAPIRDAAGNTTGVVLVFSDVTDKHAQAEKLRRSEELYAEMSRQVPGVLFQFYARSDGKFGLYFISDQSEHYFGVKAELDGFFERFTAMVVPEQREAFLASIDKAVSECGNWHFEGMFNKPSGEQIWFSANSIPSRQKDEIVFNGFLLDITPRKQAEETLRLTQFAMEHAQDGIFMIDDQGAFMYVNSAACSSMGYSRDELLGLKVFDIDPDFPVENWERHKESMRQVGAKRFESRHQAKDGRIFPVEVTSNYIGHKGRYLSIVFDRDITERKQAEAKLKRLLEDQEILLGNIEAHVWYLKDWDTYGAVNTAHARFFGKEKSMLENRPLREVLSTSGETQACMEGNKRVFEERRQIRTEEWMINGHGVSRLMAITKTPKLNESGEVEYVVCFAHDITESKKMQEMMVQTEKMMSVGGIAAGIAHEINNPLGIVLQAAQNLTLRTRPDFPKNIEAATALGLDMHLLAEYMHKRKLDVFIRDIESAARRAAVIIRNMLDFTRLSESKRAVCDPAGIVQKALALVQSDYDLKKNYDFKKIDVQVEISDELPVIHGTETEIEQVVLNLLRNAAQAMAEASPPLDSPRISIRVTGIADGLRIEVEDNGPGIAPEIQARIFDPFFTTKPPGQGTGLGLSVSYFIVTQGHKGRMSVESTPGTGARFIVELPGKPAHMEKP
jgi:PAS domain S-box-containing protein